MAPAASVIISTHNRSASLRRTVRSILRCTGGDDLYEVIVVDNGSTDDTLEVIRALTQDHSGRRLAYIRECRLGVHNARHAGARAAHAPLLLYTDDDVEVEPQWVRAYVDAFSGHPEMVAAGGPALPKWETEPAAWLRDMVASDLASRHMCSELSLIDFGDTFHPDGGVFFSLNMAIRFDALRMFGGFQPELFGSRLLGPGEWGLVHVMQRAGAPIGYVPQAMVRHRIPPERMRPEHFERWWRTAGSATEMFERWRGRPRSAGSFFADLMRILRSYWRSWIQALYTRRRANARAVRLRSHAHAGLGELVYIWWILSRRDVREFLDAKSYWP
jgi:glycosyltransferase involved in cell wall biosynthesis